MCRLFSGYIYKSAMVSKIIFSCFFTSYIMIKSVNCLENGLARTPPMGWLAWERFRCNTDCKNDPDNCISENLFRTMADILVTEGYADLGYNYINVDDCWLEKERNRFGQLVPDRHRFPRGMKSLADYITTILLVMLC
ncbi:hypothetical protein HHI36_009912 [Cryptolaemus montrouzieri]|uniref:Alpha-galactosidase n=1 Tax=Cryptolaemus montrouzieri TaxID=559131 RepID=A0ABD2MHA3_9CUCU